VVDVQTESFQSAAGGPPPTPAEVALRRAYNTPDSAPPLLSPRRIPLVPAAIMAQMGSLTPQHVDHARTLLTGTPERLRTAARSAREAPALIYGLLLEQRQPVGDAQAAILTAHTGADMVSLVRELLPHFAGLAADTRLLLAQLALPVLHQLPPAGQAAFAATCQALIEADEQLSYFEFALQKVVLRNLAVASEPSAATIQIYSFNAVVPEIALLLSALAWAGAMQGSPQADGSVSADTPTATAAFCAGASQLKLIEAQLTLLNPEACEFARIDAALDKLAGASFPIKQRLLLAAAYTVTHDNQIRDEEASLLRAFAATLSCPMPPLLDAESAAA
jgi:hypothetical protein